MHIDFKEAIFQLRALIRICVFKPNSWREICIALIALFFAPLVILVCLLGNSRYRKSG